MKRSTRKFIGWAIIFAVILTGNLLILAGAGLESMLAADAAFAALIIVVTVISAAVLFIID